MEQNGNQNLSQTPHLCKNNCGFYGSDSFEGMCSQCFKETVKRKQSTQVAAATSPSSLVSVQDRLQERIGGDRPSTSENIDVTLPTASTAERTCKVAEVKTEKAEETPGATARVEASSESAAVDTSAAASSTDATPSVAAEPQKKKKNKCHVCRKKVGLTGFGCRCGGLFCSEHRYSDKHDCKFDYKSDGQEQIRKNNPVVAGSKIQKI